jgi:hypothetical protein
VGECWGWGQVGDIIIWYVPGGGLLSNPYRVIGTAFPIYDDSNPDADIHIKTIYGVDMSSDGRTTSMGGFDAAAPEVGFSDETFVAPDGTPYRAGPASVVAIRDVPAILEPGADLSFLQGNPDDVVYIFDTDLGPADFTHLVAIDSALHLVGADSSKAGFGVNLPLTNTPATGVEPRSGGARGNYTHEFYFNNELTSVEAVTTTCGRVVNKRIDPTDLHRFLVSLSAADCNTQNVTVTLLGIVDNQGNVLDSESATVGLLIGDVDADRTVTRTDFNLVRAAVGQIADGSNYRDDINANGKIETTDGKAVRQHVGTFLP